MLRSFVEPKNLPTDRAGSLQVPAPRRIGGARARPRGTSSPPLRSGLHRPLGLRLRAHVSPGCWLQEQCRHGARGEMRARHARQGAAARTLHLRLSLLKPESRAPPVHHGAKALNWIGSGTLAQRRNDTNVSTNPAIASSVTHLPARRRSDAIALASRDSLSMTSCANSARARG